MPPTTITQPEAKTVLEELQAKTTTGRAIPRKLLKRHRHWSPCLLTNLKPVKNKGCVQVFCRAIKSKKTLTTLMLLAAGTEKEPKQQASHLCGRSDCANPSHLVLESPKDNNQRKNCRGYILTRRTAVRVPGRRQILTLGRRWVSACKHKPHCIVFD
jgi:hypothetical protein